MIGQDLLEICFKPIAVAIKIGIIRGGKEGIAFIHGKHTRQHFFDPGIFYGIQMGRHIGFECLLGYRKISCFVHKLHILLSRRQPFDKYTGGVFFFLCGRANHQATAPLDGSFCAAFKGRVRKNAVLHIFNGAIGIGDGVAVEQNTSGGTGGANQITGLGKIGGIPVIDGDAALHSRRINSVKNVIELFVFQRKRFTAEYAASQLCHTHFGKVKPGIRRVELLAAAPFIVLLRQPCDPLKGGKILLLCAGGSRKLIEQGLIYIQNLGGLGDGEHIQTAVGDPPLFHKGIHILHQFFISKVVVKIGKHTLLLELDGNLGIAGEYIRHGGRAGISVDDHGKAFVQLGAGGNGSYIDYDAFLFAHSAVKFIDQQVHGLLHIAAVIVPHGQLNGVLRVQSGIGTTGENADRQYQCQDKRNDLFHGNLLAESSQIQKFLHIFYPIPPF